MTSLEGLGGFGRPGAYHCPGIGAGERELRDPGLKMTSRWLSAASKGLLVY